MGCTRQELKGIVTRWIEPIPPNDMPFVINAIVNLLGYPHGKMDFVEKMTGYSEAALGASLKKLNREHGK